MNNTDIRNTHSESDQIRELHTLLPGSYTCMQHVYRLDHRKPVELAKTQTCFKSTRISPSLFIGKLCNGHANVL